MTNFLVGQALVGILVHFVGPFHLQNGDSGTLPLDLVGSGMDMYMFLSPSLSLLSSIYPYDIYYINVL